MYTSHTGPHFLTLCIYNSMARVTITNPLSTPGRSGLLVRGIESHVDILTRCDGWVLLWSTF